ncbi:MAG: 3-deoxy-7-phosphoheptulonate synthase [Gammaproteobacteria bacterium]|jgi:3-deoxy-7-phosphoheptulonate synthase
MQLDNLNVEQIAPLPSPRHVRADIPAGAAASAAVARGRGDIVEILEQRNPRLLVVVGPCSIHDLDAGLVYAERLAELQEKVASTFRLAMRVYFEKPRTTVGWKGFINDPHLDDSFDIEHGIREARRFLIRIGELGLPAATEALDPIIPQYLGDLLSWYAIGARTTESQTHREMASGLSAPCGFKNATDGNVANAVNAIKSANQPHHFLGITGDGTSAVIRTRGNRHAHLILRGGTTPNYSPEHVADAVGQLEAAGLSPAVMVDCSHGNSNKDPDVQPVVARACMEQRRQGQRALIGMMIESHLHHGNQTLGSDPGALRYGVSITDACIDWDTTASLLRELHAEATR